MTILYSKPSVSRLRSCYRVVAAATIAVVVVGSSWFITNFFRIPCGDQQEKLEYEFPLLQTHSWNEMGWLVGWLVCLFFCFKTRKYNDPLYLFHNAKIYYKTKRWNIKLVPPSFSCRVFLVYCPVLVLVLVSVWVLVLLQRSSCLWDAECCEEEDTRVVSWVTAQVWRRKQKSGINRMSMMEIRKLLLQSPLNCSDSVSFFLNFFFWRSLEFLDIGKICRNSYCHGTCCMWIDDHICI